jgi:hypothetical protein
VGHERLKFRMLEAAQERDAWIPRRRLCKLLAHVHKCERIEGSCHGKSLGDGSNVSVQAGSRRHRCKLSVDRMVTDTAEPVFRVPIIGLAPVQDRVNQRSIRIAKILDEIMGRVMLVMVKVGCGAEPNLSFGGKHCCREEVIQMAAERRHSQHPRPRSRAQIRKIGGSNKRPKSSVSSISHGKQVQAISRPGVPSSN